MLPGTGGKQIIPFWENIEYSQWVTWLLNGSFQLWCLWKPKHCAAYLSVRDLRVQLVSYICRCWSELHFIEPRAGPAKAINTGVTHQKEWTCEVISKGIRHPISAVYGFVCGWSVGEGFQGLGEVTEGHCLRGGGGIGGGCFHISNKFTFLFIR